MQTLVAKYLFCNRAHIFVHKYIDKGEVLLKAQVLYIAISVYVHYRSCSRSYRSLIIECLYS